MQQRQTFEGARAWNPSSVLRASWKKEQNFGVGTVEDGKFSCLSMHDGEGNGTPLQDSCLENPMDGGAWVGHDWVTSLSLFTFMHWRRKWKPIPVFLPGESQGRGSLVGCHLWGHTESDTTKQLSQSAMFSSFVLFVVDSPDMLLLPAKSCFSLPIDAEKKKYRQSFEGIERWL